MNIPFLDIFSRKKPEPSEDLSFLPDKPDESKQEDLSFLPDQNPHETDLLATLPDQPAVADEVPQGTGFLKKATDLLTAPIGHPGPADPYADKGLEPASPLLQDIAAAAAYEGAGAVKGATLGYVDPTKYLENSSISKADISKGTAEGAGQLIGAIAPISKISEGVNLGLHTTKALASARPILQALVGSGVTGAIYGATKQVENPEDHQISQRAHNALEDAATFLGLHGAGELVMGAGEIGSQLKNFVKERVMTKGVKIPFTAEDARGFYAYAKGAMDPETYDLLLKMPKEKVVDMAKRAMAGEEVFLEKRVPRFGGSSAPAPTVSPNAAEPLQIGQGDAGITSGSQVPEPAPPENVPPKAFTLNQESIGPTGHKYVTERFPTLAKALSETSLPLETGQAHEALKAATAAGEEVLLSGGTQQEAEIAAVKTFHQQATPMIEANKAAEVATDEANQLKAIKNLDIQPHEMTPEEFSQTIGKGVPPEEHRLAVQQAIESGQEVPPRVLDQYPDLAARAKTMEARSQAQEFLKSQPTDVIPESEIQQEAKALHEQALNKWEDSHTDLERFVKDQGGIAAYRTNPTTGTSEELPEFKNVPVRLRGRVPYDEMVAMAKDAGIIPEDAAYGDLYENLKNLPVRGKKPRLSDFLEEAKHNIQNEMAQYHARPVAEGQVRAREAAYRILAANKISDRVAVKLVDHIIADESALQKGYGQKATAANYDILGVTYADKLQSLIELANGATESTGRHEAFHAVTEMLLDDADQKILLDKFGDMEKAADAFGKYRSGTEENDGVIKKIFSKIKAFLERMQNYFKSKNFKNAADIFDAIDRGDFKPAPGPLTEAAAKVPRAEFIGYQDMGKNMEPLPLFNVRGEHELSGSTVSADTLKKHGIEVPKYSAETGKEFDRHYHPTSKLSPQDAAIEEKGASYARKNQEKILADYTVTHGKVISTDDFRDFLKPAGYNGENARLYHEPASALKKIYQERFLEDAKGTGQTNILIMGGGSGAGKSSYLKANPTLVPRFGAVLDTNLSHFADADAGIQRLLHAGFTPEVAFVYRDPVDAWVNGVIPRLKAENRIVPAVEHIRLHQSSLNAILKLILKYGEKIKFSIVENATDQPLREISVEDLANKMHNNYETVREVIDNETTRLKDSHEISESQRDALLHGRSESRFNNEGTGRELSIGVSEKRPGYDRGSQSKESPEVKPQYSVSQKDENAPLYAAEEIQPAEPPKNLTADEEGRPEDWTKWKQFLSNMYDRFEAVKYSKGKEIAPQFPQAGGNYTKSYVMARTLPGKIRGISETLLNELNDSLKPLKTYEDRLILNRIYSLRNYADLDRLGKTTNGITAEQATKELADLKTQIGDKKFETIGKVADQLASIQNDKGLQILVDGKIITKEAADLLKERYPNYLRSEILEEKLGQIRPEFTSADNGEPIGKINRKFLKNKQGTTKAISEDVLDVIRRSLVTKVAAAQKQIAVDQIAEDFGKPIGREFFRDGHIIKEVNPKEIPEGWVQSSVKSSGGKIFAVKKEIADLLEGLNQKETDFITRSMTSYNRIFRAGATSLRAPFVFNNIFRDVQEAVLKKRSIPGQMSQVQAYAEGAFHAFKELLGIPDHVYESWKRAGGAYGGQMSYVVRGVELPSHLTPMKDRIARAAKTALTLPFEAISRLGEFSENTSRLAEWIRVSATKMPSELKALQSRDITVDFEKAGDMMKKINQLIPFLNANVQGTVNSARVMRDHPALGLLRIGTVIAIPTAILYEWNKQFKNDDVIDPYIKDNYWYINTGSEAEIGGKKLPVLITIRKGEMAQQLSFFFQGMMEKANQDPNFKQKLANFTAQGTIDNAISTIVPPLFRVPIEEAANTNFFTGRPIITDSLKDVASKYQFKPGTSNTARRIGELTNVSPARLEHVSSGLFPASQQVYEASDKLLRPNPAIKREDKNLFPLQSVFPVLRTPTGFFSQQEAAVKEQKQNEKVGKRTDNFLFENAYRQFLKDKTAENEKIMTDYASEITGNERRRIIKKINKQEATNTLPPDMRAYLLGRKKHR